MDSRFRGNDESGEVEKWEGGGVLPNPVMLPIPQTLKRNSHGSEYTGLGDILA